MYRLLLQTISKSCNFPFKSSIIPYKIWLSRALRAFGREKRIKFEFKT